MKNALIDANGVLISHGFVDFKPQAGEAVVLVSEDFRMQPGLALWDGSAWVACAPPSTPKTLTDGRLAEALVKAGVISQAVVDAAVAGISDSPQPASSS